MDNHILRADFDIDYTYTRTYDEVQKKFFTALKNQKFLGIKAADGSVLCPPLAYDPNTSEDLSEIVELGSTATLQNWCWVVEPLPKHPLEQSFAWGLLQVEGADSCLLHAVKAASQAELTQGLKLKPVWSPEPQGCIRDVLYFEKV